MSTQHASINKSLKKSVAWVTPFLGRNGKLMYMDPLLTALAKKCDGLTVITAEYSSDANHPEFEILIDSRVRRIYWKSKDSYLRGFTFIGPSFLKSIIKSKAEVLFLVEFSLTTIYGLIAGLINRKTKIILVMENKPLKNEGKILGSIRNALRKIIARRSDAILTNNQLGRDFLINQLGAAPDKIIAKPYLVSLASNAPIINDDRFSKLDCNSKINFLFVGQVVYRKGLQCLIDAMKLLPENDRKRLHIDIVGEGDYLEYLSELISEHKLEENIKFHGKVEYSKLVDFYSSAHVFIFPTLRDYRALAPFEALNAGLPIISSIHDGGSSENVIEGVNGHVCDPLDTSTFSSIITGILKNPEKLYQYSLKSFEMSKEYTLEKAVHNMLSAVELAMSRSH